MTATTAHRPPPTGPGCAHRPDGGRALAAELADRRDWDGLWRLALDVPLVRAVDVVGHFPPGWRPPADRDRPLFDALLSASTVDIAAPRRREAC